MKKPVPDESGTGRCLAESIINYQLQLQQPFPWKVEAGCREPNLIRMYKNYTKELGVCKKLYHKIMLIMRLTTVVLIASLMQVSAAGFAQNFSMKANKASLKQVFEEIKKQTGYTVLIRSEQISKSNPVDIDLKDVPIETALKEILKDQNLVFSIEDKVVVIKKKDATFLDRLAERWANIDVRGVVVDAEGKALPGATVKVKTSGKGVSTDAKGNFFLKNVEEGAVLVVSYTGYISREVKAEKDMGNIALEVSLSKLDEVQVIAYGTTTKRLSTGNISSIKAEDIAKSPVSNPILALQGRVPGVYVEQSTGLPGGDVKVRIQGTNSIRNGNDPLYVVDGVPFVSTLLPSVSTVLGDNGLTDGPGSPLNFINPSDIESINVLKDADATAIYGSRAANGAVIITTKKGVSGETKVNLNLRTGWGKVTRTMDLLNTQQYLAIRKEAYANDGIDLNAPPYNEDIYKALVYPDLGIFDQNRYTDWQKELIGNTAQYRDAQASVSGGNSTTQFNLSTGYHRETTVFPGDLSDTKKTVGLNLNHLSPNQKFRVQFSANYMEDKNKLINADLTALALNTPPNAPSMYNSDGSINWQLSETGISTFVDNPARILEQKFQNNSTNLLSNLVTSYTIATGLTLKSSFGYNKLQSNEHKINPLSALPPEYTSSIVSSVNDANKSIESWIAEPQVNYTHLSDIGSFDFLAGMTFQKNSSDYTAIDGSGFGSDADLNNIATATAVTIANRLASFYNYNAFFARLNYNWQNKYMVNLSARRDGSSRFGTSNLFQNFFSVAGAWTFTEEQGIKEFLPFVNFGKLRATYGTTGNDQIGDYQFLSLYSSILYNVPYQGITGIIPITHASPYIQWEETKKINVGLDLSLLENKIDLTVNYYRNRSGNQLLLYALPSVTGFTNVLKNLPAIVQNTGFETQINYHLTGKNGFNWETGFNATIPRNKLLAFPDLASSTYANQLIVGQPMTIKKLFRFSGVNSQTGLYEFKNSKGEITSNPDPNADQTAWVSTEPTLFGGWSNSFNYKGFTLDFLVQYVKQKGANIKYGIYLPGLNVNQPVGILARWQAPGNSTDIQKMNTDLSVFSQYYNALYSTGGYSDASFIRLKNVSLSYSFPKQLVQQIKMSNAKVYLQGQNLFTITKFDGLDPENRSVSSLPPLRVISLGFQCTF